MEPFILDPAAAAARQAALGAVVCQEISARGKRLFRKGHVITETDLAALATVERPFHAARLGPNDIHEDPAGIRLAAAIAGEGVEARKPVQSRVNLAATRKGLLRVEPSLVTAINLLPGPAVFTLLDRLPVVAGKIVAGAKITPVAVDRVALEQAESIARARPVVQVKAFLPLRAGVIVTEGIAEKTRERFRATVEKKLGWYGAQALNFAEIDADPAAVAAAMDRFTAAGADLILTAGGNTIDPLDATLVALRHINATIVAYGAPAHPGSMFWLAYRGELPVFNLASCSMYSKSTVADLVLPWIMAGERVGPADIANLGHGGLLNRDMGFRFPAPYDAERASEADEE